MTAPPTDGSRVALVTGAGRGIGAAVVHRMARSGWRVVATDRCTDDRRVPYPLASREQLAAVAAQHPETVVDAVADVQDLDALRRAVDLARERFGGLDAAVAGAGLIAGGKPLWETGEAEWDALFSVGVNGVANLARAAVPALLERPRPRNGRFVALASAAAHHGLWHLAGYNAAKHAVVGLVKGLANDLRGTGVCATAVSPGSTRTDMLAATARLYDLDEVEEFATHQLVDRLLDADEVAAAVCFLCSPESSAITGTVVHADGGFTP
ncbi:SDR family mycofactocin-dependent oxidoreductase [Saccharomonospora amisosensis]|uniref:SDR family mycofactocin-dependent oxidoreductase n=1 Tax=Saccharomonospora amisosensis TaxID=1128677 RepID=A0A7X5UU41_9PSEU|nr:mycofactocin-coupled SDR family oxidoreductase [Saccharomonospora amisosensis]NIJ13739.1 SDR family mycofactocin-dependent oxidoreductase [Saccharomonospora amisosensis]